MRRLDVSAVTVGLRRAEPADCERLWRWRNDPVTRQNSLNTAEIPFERHEEWFKQQLGSPDVALFIIEAAPVGEPCGQVRLNALGEGDAVVSIGIAPSHRRRGIAAAALRLVASTDHRPDWASRLFAVIRKENVASRVAFERAGYRGPIALVPSTLAELPDAVGVWELAP